MRSYCSDQVVQQVPDLAAKMRACMFEGLEGRRQQEQSERIKEQKQREKDIRRLQKEYDESKRKNAELQVQLDAAIAKSAAK